MSNSMSNDQKAAEATAAAVWQDAQSVLDYDKAGGANKVFSWLNGVEI